MTRHLETWMLHTWRRAVLVAVLGALLIAGWNAACLTVPRAWAATPADVPRILLRRPAWTPPHRWQINPALTRVITDAFGPILSTSVTVSHCTCWGPPIPRKPVCICQ